MVDFLLMLLCILILAVLAVYAFLQQPKFGKAPKGKRLDRIRAAGNYDKGQFQNLSHTATLSGDAKMSEVLYDFFFRNNPNGKPPRVLPSLKTNLKALNPAENVLVWFGHSSYFLQVDGLKILVDPVFSGAASPISATTRSFAGSDVYTTDDFPEIDVLLISHDHWDHLDYRTIRKLQPKIASVVCALGVGAHLESWGYDPDKIFECNWHEHLILKDVFRLDCCPARHFSGRGLKRNGSLFASYVLRTPSKKIYIGGDSGYDVHFKNIGAQHGPFDLAILECGQYNKAWSHIHLLPEQEMTVAAELQAKAVLPVHWAKFRLALHDWDEPIREITRYGSQAGIPIWTPMIGETVYLDGGQAFSRWWETV